MRTSFRTTSIIRNCLNPRRPTADIFNKSEIYQLKHIDYILKYVGQAGRAFNTLFEGHKTPSTLNIQRGPTVS
jgi:hypothetical protein